MADQDEAVALRGRLPVTLGGISRDLRVLTLDEADEWVSSVATLISGLDVDPIADPGQLIAIALRQGTAAAIEAVVAYDREGKLGGPEGIRKVGATPGEVREALAAMFDAALPFDPDSARSVAAAFGGPIRYVSNVLMMTMARIASRPESSTDGPDEPGASTSTPSGGPGPQPSSSSAGHTGKRQNGVTAANDGTSSLTA